MMEQAALSPQLSPEQARMLSPLQLAFVGDSVHALLVRTALIGQDCRVRDMHLQATGKVNAVAQSKALTRILPRLNEDELAIVKRGRNAHSHHSAPKSATTGEYAGATGLEALLGYLFLIGDIERLKQLAAWMQTSDTDVQEKRCP